MSDIEIARHPEYAPKIREIAALIGEHYKRLKSAPQDACHGCADFVLPSEAEIKQWLEEAQGTVAPFPGR